MTLKNLWNISDSPLLVMDETSGKILTHNYTPSRHPGIGNRPVVRQFALDEKSVGLKSEWTHNYIHVVVGV